MSRKLLTVALSGLALVALALLASRVAHPPSDGETGLPGDQASSSSAPASRSEPALQSLDPLSATRTRESAIRGVIVDPLDRPLADARVWISAPGDDWALGIAPPVVDALGAPVRAFETRTQSDGHFELRVPSPSAERVRLDVVDAEYRGHTSRELTSGTVGPGDIDLGRIVVARESALGGRVRTRGGAPLAGAIVTRRHDHGNGGFASTRSDSSGRYVFAEVSPGIYSVSVEAARHLSAVVTRLVVAAETARADLDFELVPAPVLSGRVIDTSGAPISGVRLHASPVDAGAARFHRDVDATSSAAGEFEIVLADDARHWLWAQAADHGEWKSWNTPARDFAADTREIEIRLTSRAVTRLHPEDSRTHAPLDVLGVEDVELFTPPAVFPVEQSRRRRVPHADSCARIGRVVELDSPPQRVIVWAPGYAPREVQLTGSAEEIVALEPLGGVSGSFVREGTSCATAALVARRVVPGEPARAWLEDLPPPEAEERAATESVTLYTWPRRVHADASGAFHIARLQPGEYELAVIEDGRRWMDPLPGKVTVLPGATKDLGRVPLARERASLRVKLELAESQPALARYLLRGTVNGQPLSLNGARTSELCELPAGRVEIVFAENAPLVCAPRRWSVDLAAGDVRELTVDLSDVEVCAVDVRLANDSPLRRTRTVLLRCLDADGNDSGEPMVDLGLPPLVSQREVARAWVRGGARVGLEARDGYGVVVLRSEMYALPRNGEFDVTLLVP